MTSQRIGDSLEKSFGTLTPDVFFMKLDGIDDPEQRLAMIKTGADNEFRVNVYSERDVRERVQDTEVSRAAELFEHGRSSQQFQPVAATERTLATIREQRVGGDNDLQTQTEAMIANDSKLLEQVKDLFNNSFALGKLPESYKLKKIVEEWPLAGPDGKERRRVPFITTFMTGLTSMTIITPIKDPDLSNAPKALRICRQSFFIEDVRKVTLDHVVKSSKTGFQFGLGFAAGFGSEITATAQAGEKVFANGKEKVDQTSNKTLTFNFETIRQRAKLRFDAHQRLAVEIGRDKMLCQEG